MATVPVKYVGYRQSKTDLTAGTGLVWKPGQVHQVPEEAARVLLKYPDVWALAGNAKLKPERELPKHPLFKGEPGVWNPDSDKQHEEVLPAPMPSLLNKSKQDMVQIAKVRFGQTLDSAMPIEDMRMRLVALENAGRAIGV